MAGKSPTFDNQVLSLILNGTAMTGLAQNQVSSPLAVLYVSLHTADPTSGATVSLQTGSEATYTGYTRPSLNRSTGSGGFTVTGGNAVFGSQVSFAQCTGGSNNITYFAVGTAAYPSAGEILWYGPVSPSPLAVSNGVTPILLATTNITES